MRQSYNFFLTSANIFDILCEKVVFLRGKHPIIINRGAIFRFFKSKFNDYNPLKKKATDNQYDMHFLKIKFRKICKIQIILVTLQSNFWWLISTAIHAD